MTQKTVAEVMVDLEFACTLSPDAPRQSKVQLVLVEDVLDYSLIAQVVQQGFSRFPVVDPGTKQARRSGPWLRCQVVSLLHCKDLLSLREPECDLEEGRGRSATVGELLEALRAAGRERQVYVCGKDTTLMALLAESGAKRCLGLDRDSSAGHIWPWWPRVRRPRGTWAPWLHAPSFKSTLGDVDVADVVDGVRGIVTLHNIFGAILWLRRHVSHLRA